MVVQDHPACTAQRDQGEVLIDTVSITLELNVLVDYCRLPWQLLRDGLQADSDPDDYFAVWQSIAGLLFHLFGGGLKLEQKFSKGRNFFRHSLAMQDSCGFVAFGGNNMGVNAKGEQVRRAERIQIYLTGEGCQRVHDWNWLADSLEKLADFKPSITRVDIAYDDHEGYRGVDDARAMYADGEFTNRGRPPKAQYIDDMGSDDGCTFYVGDRANGKTLRVYQKGKQLGDTASDWTRWELELKSQDREIPFDVFRRPAHYLAGGYPALAFISTSRLLIQTGKLKAAIQYAHLIKHASNSYGSLINYMAINRGLTPDEIVGELVKGGTPKRLVWTTFEHDTADRPPLPDHCDRYPHLYNTQQG